jgi:hypothetical protein
MDFKGVIRLAGMALVDFMHHGKLFVSAPAIEVGVEDHGLGREAGIVDAHERCHCLFGQCRLAGAVLDRH